MDSYRQDFRGQWFRLSREGEGFEEESEPEADPVTNTGGGSRVPRGIEMRDDPDEQEQVFFILYIIELPLFFIEFDEEHPRGLA
ncbi:hypothetical protein AK812_SmicGene6853 [Symbiodinium microadriaticum]|uniref:Uncharacterized protein n=1 Tax=Symbiodinium microadriaticum TaxID=2951 RepID=A0A1Q9EPZ5_SYMMI|nr:hypothetical protein AK812_SmicGene6853 [Symbiodinium microadriaticum]